MFDQMTTPEHSTKRTFAWTMYDWANSAFTTIVVTFLYSTYFSQAMAPDDGTGTVLWSRAVSISAIIIALLSPVMGVIADRSGRRRGYLIGTTLLCCTGTVLLTFIEPNQPNAILLALTIFVIANVAFEVSMVFYNSFLLTIAPADRIGRISGYGWAMGYVGGMVAMIVALLAFIGFGIAPPWLGLDTTDGFNIRAVNLLVAGWYLLFSLPMFLLVKDDGIAAEGGHSMRGAFEELRHTLGQLRRYAEVVKLLVARLVYNDGLGTVFAFGGIYAAGTFGMGFADVMVFGIVLNLAAGLGAWVFGFVDDKLGGKKTIAFSLVALSIAVTIAVVAPNRTWFWIGGILFGLFAGPNQSASRSLMGRFLPEDRKSEFFGFFAFSGKVTSFAGPILLGVMTQAFDNQRAGMATVVLFFIIGGVILSKVDEAKGLAAGHEASA